MTDKIAFSVGGERHELPIESWQRSPMSGSFKLSPPKIMFRLEASGEPVMTIHPDGRIALGENAQPTEAAAACIDAMSHMIQSMIDRAAADERAAIVAWMMCEEKEYPSTEYNGFVAMIREEIEAGEHLK